MALARCAAIACGIVGLLVASPAHATWQNSFAFGATLQGDLYTPPTLATSPAILVAIHMCTGHSSTVHGWFDTYADAQGFYIIAPDAGKQCFDSSASRDGDKAAIVKMVNYLIMNKNADKNRVFAAGMSSGGCMTNTLLAIYPDVFVGGSAMPGFPAGAWPAGDTTCTKCGSQPPNMSGAQWGALARSVFSWSGTYPCSQQWVGGGDEYNFNGWLPSVVAQFQNLGNLGAGMTATGRTGWTRTVYKDGAGNIRLETNLGPTTQRHDLETVSPNLYGDVITFLGLDKPTGACGIAGPTLGTGGAPGTGGASGSGGARGTGGTSGTGGAPGAGGAVGSGGISGAGGRGTGGGSSGSGGSTGSGGLSGGGGSLAGTGGGGGSGGLMATGSGGALATGSGGSIIASSTGGTGATGTGGTPGGQGTGGLPATGMGGGSNPEEPGPGLYGCATAGTGSGGGWSIAFLALAFTLAGRLRRRR